MFDSCLSEFGCRRHQGKFQRPVKDGRGNLWFTSSEFGRIALNGGFELTVRDRLLEPLHLELNGRESNYSIISEYSRHGMGGNLRADIALLDEPLNDNKAPRCKTIFELKTNFRSQFREIKSRTQNDFDKWFSAKKPMAFDYCYLHLVIDINPSVHKGYFPKYQKQNPAPIAEVNEFFVDFAEHNGCSLLENVSNPYSAECKYPCYDSPIKINTYFFILERNSAQ